MLRFVENTSTIGMLIQITVSIRKESKGINYL